MIVHEAIRLWSGDAPYATGNEPRDIPTAQLYLPDGEGPFGCVVVCPGGGYEFLAEHEGPVIAEYFAQRGIAAVLVRYRIAPKYHQPAIPADAQRAMRLTRAKAREWKIKPDRIAIMGFSAGGHLASTISTQWDELFYSPGDDVDWQTARPDASLLIYPVLTMDQTWTHGGSRINLLSMGFNSELCTKFSSEKNVTAKTPPAFLFTTSDDGVVPMENSLHYAMACHRHGVPVELHSYETGPHGVSLAQDRPDLASWPGLMIQWLRQRGW